METHYTSYKDIRNSAEAEAISKAMGVDDPVTGIANTSSLVEVRTATDHTRIDAHSTNKFAYFSFYDNGGLETVSVNTKTGDVTKKTYNPETYTVTNFTAKFNPKLGVGQFTETGQEKLSRDALEAERSMYHALVLRAKSAAK